MLWGGVTAAIAGATSLFVFGDPQWLFPSAALAGAVASLRSGYYEQSATNGLVAVVVGLVFLLPALFVFRAETLTIPGTIVAPDRGNWLLYGTSGTLVDLAVFGPLMLVFGYLAAAVVDVVESRIRSRRGADGESRRGADGASRPGSRDQ